MASNYRNATELVDEPTLDELFAEPIIQLIMRRDGVEREEMHERMQHLQQYYRATIRH